MSLKLSILVLFFSSLLNAQSNEELKAFINKNDVAIRAVQKNMIRENNVAYINSFKEILKNQEIAVKMYSKDNSLSGYYANLVRNASLEYLKGHTNSSTEYFEISSSEKSFLNSKREIKYVEVLSKSEIIAIEKIDAMNPHSLNNLILTVQ